MFKTNSIIPKIAQGTSTHAMSRYFRLLKLETEDCSAPLKVYPSDCAKGTRCI